MALGASFIILLASSACHRSDPFAEVGSGSYAPEAREQTRTAKAEPAPVPAREKHAVENTGADRIRVYSIGRLADVFNDSNRYQYEVAEQLGISPVSTFADAFYTRRPLVKIESNDLYAVDELTHSLPYLVPEAQQLLATIGRNFIDSLKSRGAGGYRIKATSLLRTPATVRQLRRVNRNATDSSTHQFGTTFDLTYVNFHKADPKARDINDGDLKNLLAEVLYDLRRQQKCMVKFEKKSTCFHITATGK